MPSAIEVQEFSEQLYFALDPQDRGFVDLRIAAQRLASLAPAVAEFVRRVLVACEDEFEPSAFVFKSDLIGRLIFAVGQEYDNLTSPEKPKSGYFDKPLIPHVSRVSQVTPRAEAGAEAKAAGEVEGGTLTKRRDSEKRKQELVAESLRECTFTPKVGRGPRPGVPRRSMDHQMQATAPETGAQLEAEVDQKFRTSLRRGTPDLRRLTRPTENFENRGHSRAFLIFRINEADKFHSFMISNVAN